MMRTAIAGAVGVVGVCAAAASGQTVVWENGAFVTAEDAGFDGADISVTQSGTATSLNFNAALAPPSGPGRVADDFTVANAPAGGLELSRLHFYGTHSQSSNFTTDVNFTAAYVTVYSGDPVAGAPVLAGDFTTNRLIDTEWTGAYRVSSSDTLSRSRPIMRLIIDMSWVPPLQDGTYWLVVSAIGDTTIAANPNTHTILVTPMGAGDNGRQFFNGNWIVLPVDFPFELIADDGAACPGDFNGASGATVQDIYDFLSDWSSQVGGGPVIVASADFNGAGGVTVQDIYDFLSAWSAGCP